VITLMLMLISAPETSKIDSVTVFADRAEVTRVAAADCKSKVATAIFEPLPHTLDVRTLRGEAKGGVALGVASSELSGEQAMGDKTKELVSKRKALDDRIQEKQNEMASLDLEVKRIAELAAVFTRVLSEEVRNEKPQIALWNRTLDRFKEKEAAISRERLALERELRELTREKARLERRFQRLGAASARRARRAEVTVRCEQERVQVSLTYLVPGALWRPEYDLDFTPASGKVGPGAARLTVAAVVQQATGEDWSDVRLSLSTAKPKLGAEAPYPAPIWVSGAEKPEGKVLVEGYQRRDELASGEAQLAAAPQSAALKDGGQAVVLELPHRVSVVADGRPYWTPVDAIAAKGSASLVAIPKLRGYVYRMVSLTNPASYPLLEGRVHSFRAGSYVGDTHVPFKGTGEPMEVSLGIDEEITVERKTLTQQDRGASFLGSTKHMARAYRILVKNRSKTREKVEVRENIPVSKIEDVEVELIAAGTTAGHRLDEERGFVVWTLDLPPGGQKEVDLAYEIHLPDDWKASNF
jgi:uncharacterized protein (TIGR02231 family)